MINVEVWADIRCPWCWIGHRRIQTAIATSRDDVQVRRRSFLLEPNGPTTPGRPIAEVALAEWGMTPGQWQAKSDHIRTEGLLEGLQINIDSALTFDSRPVHQLLKLAEQLRSHDMDMLWEIAFDSHFRRNYNLGHESGLRKLAREIGLGAKAFDQAISGDAYADAVMEDMRRAKQLGITSVPTVIVSDERRLSGNQSVGDLSALFNGMAVAR